MGHYATAIIFFLKQQDSEVVLFFQGHLSPGHWWHRFWLWRPRLALNLLCILGRPGTCPSVSQVLGLHYHTGLLLGYLYLFLYPEVLICKDDLHFQVSNTQKHLLTPHRIWESARDNTGETKMNKVWFLVSMVATPWIWTWPYYCCDHFNGKSGTAR